MTLRLLLAAFLAVAMTASARGGQNPPAGCSSSLDIPASLLSVQLVVFGEIHGTNEAPQFVARYVCELLRRSRPVILALEIDRSNQEAFDTYLLSDGAASSEDRLMAAKHWQTNTPDGRSSLAMLDLIRFARVARASGGRVELLLFDEWPRDRPRDAATAENIRAAILANPTKDFVVLVGNLHAMKRKGYRSDPEYQPMVYRLADLNPVSLNIRHATGTMWTCRAARNCGETPVRGLPAPFSSPNTIELGASLFAPGFDGQYFVGAVTASRPAGPHSKPPATGTR